MDFCKTSDENDSDSDKFIMLSCNSKGMEMNGEQSHDEHRKYSLFALREAKAC